MQSVTLPMIDFVLPVTRCPPSESASPVRPEAVEQSAAPDRLQRPLRSHFRRQVSASGSEQRGEVGR